MAIENSMNHVSICHRNVMFVLPVFQDEGMHKNLRSLYDSYGCLSDLNFNIHCKSPPLKKCKVERNV